MNIALVLSGGTGIRLGTDVPKQYLEVCGRPVITFAAETLLGHDGIDAVHIAAEAVWQDRIAKWLAPYDARKKIRGFSNPGANRQLSIFYGLEAIKTYAKDTDCVLIHDAARPMLSEKLITDCFDGMQGHDGVMPALPMKDTIYASRDGRRISSLLKRSEVFAGQSPEAFRLGPYYEANRRLLPDKILQISGSAEAAVLAGLDVAILSGDEANFKITTTADFKRFRRIVKERADGSGQI